MVMSTTPAAATAIRFTTTPYYLGDWLIVRLPAEASQKLPSRGQVMVTAACNGTTFRTPLEPDGNFSHWFRADAQLIKAARLAPGVKATLEITPPKDWPEPEIPADFQRVLAGSEDASELWQRITPMARWEWMRWTRSTARAETHKHRLEVAISKLEHGERRPCCWNRNMCTEPSVSKNGVLLGPAA